MDKQLLHRFSQTQKLFPFISLFVDTYVKTTNHILNIGSAGVLWG